MLHLNVGFAQKIQQKNLVTELNQRSQISDNGDSVYWIFCIGYIWNFASLHYSASWYKYSSGFLRL